MVTIQPEEVLNARGAARLLDDLKSARGKDVSVDCSSVRHLGAVAFMVLASAKMTWRGGARHFVLSNPSREFLAAASTLGLPDLAQPEDHS